ncbi:MAG: alpha/beta fold hydrolase [Granulosicoccus sp.]|nr:alpha/beta fold hydrolase [Granulosicoccus sp.]
MPERRKFEFAGAGGDSLAALLELPDAEPIATALFAHCFTCGKDVLAASRISRALVDHGYAVMRFDFTGLGGSDGDFSNTNFSSNIDDLLAAADHLREEGLPPSLLIGHSLGGTAVLRAAHDIPECRGVVTIASPADASHVAESFHCDLETIEREGEAQVDLAGRVFTIRKQFLDDLKQTPVSQIGKLKAALLIMHSPVDLIVDITEAEKIYTAARHPKSFISLENADHLLTRSEDARFVADMISAWALRQVGGPPSETRPAVKSGEVCIHERDHIFMLDVFSDSHHWIADEPVKVGGRNAGPDPYEHLLAAVGTCTAMTIRLYAARKQWPLDDVTVKLQHSREHARDCEDCAERASQLDVVKRDITLHGNLDEEQQKRLMDIADRCPVHRTLTGQLSIRTRQIGE